MSLCAIKGWDCCIACQRSCKVLTAPCFQCHPGKTLEALPLDALIGWWCTVCGHASTQGADEALLAQAQLWWSKCRLAPTSQARPRSALQLLQQLVGSRA